MKKVKVDKSDCVVIGDHKDKKKTIRQQETDTDSTQAKPKILRQPHVSIHFPYLLQIKCIKQWKKKKIKINFICKQWIIIKKAQNQNLLSNKK